MSDTTTIKGRGALSNIPGRFARNNIEALLEDDFDEQPAAPRTTLHPDASRSILTSNRSPDVPFHRSINPYRGCEHGCVYCFARPTHSYLDLSPGIDFETQIFYKPRAVELLKQALTERGYSVSPIALGTNTDPYQPAERRLKLTRGILELLLEHGHPVTIVTKSGLVLRDLDLLEQLAARNLVGVHISVTTLDAELKRVLEPRTAGPERRLRVIRELVSAGVPTGVLVAPIIPALNDHELEAILEAAADAGAKAAGYVLLRLPHEVRPLFVEWLEAHYPDRARHVLSLMEQMRGGRLNDPRFHSRQRGAGPFADLLRSRFEKARRRLMLDQRVELRYDLFSKPLPQTGQLSFF